MLRRAPLNVRVNAPVALAVAMVMGCAVVLVACSGSDNEAVKESTTESLRKLGITDSPETLLAVAIEQPRVSLVVGADFVRAFTRVRYAVRGYLWAESACAADKAMAVVGSPKVDRITFGELQKLDKTMPATDLQARECATADSLARIDVEVPKGATSAPNPAPDIDGAAVRDMFAQLYRATAEQAGFTSKEGDCVVAKVVDVRSPEEFVKIVTGGAQIRPEDTASDVASCLSPKRAAELVPKVGKAILADKRAAREEHDRKQAELDKQIEEFNRTSTTAAG